MIAPIAGPNTEISMECNPEDITTQQLQAWHSIGIHRLSIGMQTLNPKFAHLLNRGCTTEYARDILQEVKNTPWRSWSIDLIFALPGQSLDDLNQDLDAVLELAPPHVSLYGLTWEEGTPFSLALAQGKMKAVSDDEWRNQYDLIRNRLLANGFEQYEVSNFAKPGHQSQHNLLYWSDAPYLGLGPSAHGYRLDGTRTQHAPDIVQYLKNPTVKTHQPSADQQALDMLIGGIRSTAGLDTQRLYSKTGLGIETERIRQLTKQGLITVKNGRIIPTHDGFPLSDAIVDFLTKGLVPQTDSIPLFE